MALSQPISGPLHLPKEAPSAPARTALPSRPMTTRQPPAQLFGARPAESTSSEDEGSATGMSPTSSRMDESRYATSNPTLSPKSFAREPSLGSSSRAPSEAVSGSAGQVCRYEMIFLSVPKRPRKLTLVQQLRDNAYSSLAKIPRRRHHLQCVWSLSQGQECGPAN